jgi:predicted O-methyltransferase YrrM
MLIASRFGSEPPALKEAKDEDADEIRNKEMKETDAKSRALRQFPLRGLRGYSRLRLTRKYLRYYFGASNGKGHGIHSPFVFDFITQVLNDTREYPAYARVEGLRQRLLKDGTMLEIEDLGAGSVAEVGGYRGAGGYCDAGVGRYGVIGAGNEPVRRERVVCHRSVADIARHAAKSRKLGQLLFRIASHYQPRTMVELGTSLGLSAAYLASGAEEEGNAGDVRGAETGMKRVGEINGGSEEGASVEGAIGSKPGENGGTRAKLLTIEGAGSVAGVAEANFRSLGLEHIALMTGGFDDVLPGALEKMGKIDLAFVDGNHRREPTLRYFDLLMRHASPSAVLIFDDIHWSREMEEAWEGIRQDARVLLTIDLFFIGLVFLRPAFKVKQDFIIRF